MQRNNIAAEIEKVISALTIRSFSRDQFLRELDRFYKAIEDAAGTIQEFSEKQKFLNTSAGSILGMSSITRARNGTRSRSGSTQCWQREPAPLKRTRLHSGWRSRAS